MRQFVMLIVAVVAISFTAKESKAQGGFYYGSYNDGQGLSISIGGGYYDPGYGGWGGGWGGYYPPFRPQPFFPYPSPHAGYGWGHRGWGGFGGWGGWGCDDDDDWDW